MKPGNASQWYPGDPPDLDLELYEEPKPPQISTCPGDLFMGESIGASPNIFNTGQRDSSHTCRSLIGAANLLARYEPEQPDKGVRVTTPFGSYTVPAPPRDDGDNAGSDSSNDANAKNKMARRKNHPFLPPAARFLKGGADPADPRRPKTDRELFGDE